MKKLILSFVLLASLYSCESYLDVNEDQTNNADASALAPNQMLAGAINNYMNLQAITLSSYGNKMAYVWGINYGFTTTDSAYDYNYTSSSYSNIWESLYLFADNFQDITDKEATKPEYAYHYGISKAMKALCMDYVVSLYGDAPYTQAFQGSNNAYPAYDDDKEIIKNLFTLLDSARDNFNNAPANVVALGAEDIVFGGDTNEWIKFINTIELKLLLRLSNTTNPEMVALRNARFASLPQNFVDTDVTVNPGYNGSATGQFSPLYRTYGVNIGLTAFTGANRANAAGDYIAKVLNGTLNNATLTTGLVDPRRTRLFGTVAGTVQGNVQGTFPAATISRVAGFFTGFTGANTQDAANNGQIRDAFLMLAAESKFLQAEAVQRGYMAGNAQTLFNEGVTASFQFYSTGWGTVNPSALNAVTYLTNVDGKNGLGWTGSTDKLNCIMTQKYLALANWHGIELYLDHLRTGYPNLPLPVGVTPTSRPNRLIYPTSEYSSNSQNVPNVTNNDLFTVNSKTPFYLQ